MLNQPVYKEDVTLTQILLDGIGRGFEYSQIIDEAGRSGFIIDNALIEIVSRDFNARMINDIQSIDEREAFESEISHHIDNTNFSCDGDECFIDDEMAAAWAGWQARAALVPK